MFGIGLFGTGVALFEGLDVAVGVAVRVAAAVDVVLFEIDGAPLFIPLGTDLFGTVLFGTGLFGSGLSPGTGIFDTGMFDTGGLFDTGLSPAGTDGDRSDALSGMDASGVGVEDFECDGGRNAYSWTILIAKLSSSSIVFSIIGNR